MNHCPKRAANAAHGMHMAFLVSNRCLLVFDACDQSTPWCRVQVHDCMVEMAQAVCKKDPSWWSWSSYNPTTVLAEVCDACKKAYSH